jgi:thioredoxin reductase (NADPH)
MSSIPVPDEQTYYSSRRQDDVDALAWPVFSQRALDLLRSAGEVLHPEPGELLWDTGDTYDLYLVLAGGVLLWTAGTTGCSLSSRKATSSASWAC